MTDELTEKEKSIELREIARSINDREQTIKILKRDVFGAASKAVAEAKLQGQELIKVKSMVKRGDWMDWLAAYCPQISYSQANKYITVATNFASGQNLDEAGSLEAALAICDYGSYGKKAEPRQKWEPYVAAIGRIHDFLKFITNKKAPVDTWPDCGKQKLREDLSPVVKVLWPDKF